MAEPFYFYTRLNLVRLLGRKAKDPLELLEGIKEVPLSSIYYHTHKFLQQHHYLSPEPPNDFAYWINNILNMRSLGEALASINIIKFKNLDDLRTEFIKILSSGIASHKHIASCQEDMEFYFISCQTFIVQTPYVAHTIQEFISLIEKITIDSLYYHIFEAKMRLKRYDNDFSAWLNSIGQKKCAEKISFLDPYTFTLDGLRKKIMEVTRQYATY